MSRFIASLLILAALSASAAVDQFFVGKAGQIDAVRASGKVTRVEVLSAVTGGSATIERIRKISVFTPVTNIVSSTATNYTVTASNRVVVALHTYNFPTASEAQRFTASHPLWSVLSYTTNRVTTAVTNVVNTFTRAFAVTNTIVTGTLSGGIHSAAPSNDIWIAPGDSIRTTGTASPCNLRIFVD